MRSLGDFVDFTDDDAKSQWSRILERPLRARQEPYQPVEVILCYGLFRIVDPHDYRGGTADQAPEIVARPIAPVQEKCRVHHEQDEES